MSDMYILGPDGRTPVATRTVGEWGEWFEKADRKVAKTDVGDVHVSTVFLGIDHGFGRVGPLLFETLVFGGPLDGEMDRYATWAEAERGHAAMVARVESGEVSL